MPATTEPSITALLVTRNRPTLLARSIRSLLAARARCPELKIRIRIGINGPDSESSKVIAELERETGGQAQGLFELVELPGALSPAGARNEVLEGARGEWIFFIDDDAFVPETVFSDFLEIARRFPEASAVGGPNLTPPGSSLFQRASGAAMGSRFATLFSSARYRPVGNARACGEESLILCNLFVKRRVLGTMPFQASLVCAEENWLLRRLEREGCFILYSPRVSVWHERRPSLSSLARQLFRYGFGRGQTFRLKGGALRFPHLVPALAVLHSALCLGLFIQRGAVQPELLLPFLLYAPLCALAGLATIREDRLGAGLLSIVLFPIIHGFYGLGVIFGLARRS